MPAAVLRRNPILTGEPENLAPSATRDVTLRKTAKGATLAADDREAEECRIWAQGSRWQIDYSTDALRVRFAMAQAADQGINILGNPGMLHKRHSAKIQREASES